MMRLLSFMLTLVQPKAQIVADDNKALSPSIA